MKFAKPRMIHAGAFALVGQAFLPVQVVLLTEIRKKTTGRNACPTHPPLDGAR
jgi:hypothetical protein